MNDEIEALQHELTEVEEKATKCAQEISRLETIAESLRCPALVDNRALRANQREQAAHLANRAAELQQAIAEWTEQAEAEIEAKVEAHDKALGIEID